VEDGMIVRVVWISIQSVDDQPMTVVSVYEHPVSRLLGEEIAIVPELKTMSAVEERLKALLNLPSNTRFEHQGDRYLWRAS
jgi:hypothetical protein